MLESTPEHVLEEHVQQLDITGAALAAASEQLRRLRGSDGGDQRQAREALEAVDARFADYLDFLTDNYGDEPEVASHRRQAERWRVDNLRACMLVEAGERP